MSSKEEGKIKQGTIAEYMRKRTQLVGFEFGYWKHVQFCAEFIDNALDAIESFQWKELQKPDSILQKFSIVEAAKEEKVSQHLDNEAKHTLMKELGIETSDSEDLVIPEPEIKDDESGEIIDEAELEIEEEVKRVIGDMQEIIKPVEMIIDVEPIVIVRIREYEAPAFLTTEISQKNVMSFTFEIFDNGTGMSKIDLRKFGRYLASSKSMELKQTRGSQGFGAPSAFSDAQNTTGKPIVVVSKTAENVYATVNEFFTTSKNEKKYLIHPTDIDSPFLHGTYVKLNYLNVKYVKGYVEKYIEETAYMNPHITVIYIDPEGKEKIYRRLASAFPKEPKYAKPHPSSVNIGDLQDLIAKSDNNTLGAFLKENFVRVSSKTAKEIVEMAERDIQDKLNLLILKDGFITNVKKKTDDIHYIKYEKRIFGKSTKPRDKLIVYKMDAEDLIENTWSLLLKYNNTIKDHEKVNKEIRKLNNRIEKTETQREKKNIEKDIKALLSKINKIRDVKEEIKIELQKLFDKDNTGLTELKKIKTRNDFEDLTKEVQISKTKPIELTKEQFNSLFLAFKSMKYMAPPTETAIPVGELILENTLIKEIGLKISEDIDNFETPIDSFKQLIEQDTQISGSGSDEATIPQEITNLSSEILRNVNIYDERLDHEQIKQSIINLVDNAQSESIESYKEVFEYFAEIYTKDDDFVSAESRSPTSGKGLAYVVEAVMAYSRQIEVPKRSRDILSRFVNRTPKLRDNADCAITKAVQSVNWKNYGLETYDNGLPKGPIKLLVNVSGPFVHLMFKSQSKNALADDEDLIKEIKFCLEAIGRRVRVYINRKANLRKSEKRASLIEKYIPKFAESIYNIASQGESKFKAEVKREIIEDLMKGAIGKKSPALPPQPSKSEIQPSKEMGEVKPKPSDEQISKRTLNNWTIKELRDYCIERGLEVPSKIKKEDIINQILRSYETKKKPKLEIEPIEKPPIEPPVSPPSTVEPEPLEEPVQALIKAKKAPPSRPKPKPVQTTLPLITSDRILQVLSDEWQNIKHLIFKLKIKDMMDARYLQLKLKELERKDQVKVDIKVGRKHWKLKKGG
ncbi:MAG: DNA topoisomerase VI subunit B [Promethearchaeota archaeon]|jgi:DNA topoisomerase VI B subunit